LLSGEYFVWSAAGIQPWRSCKLLFYLNTGAFYIKVTPCSGSRRINASSGCDGAARPDLVVIFCGRSSTVKEELLERMTDLAMQFFSSRTFPGQQLFAGTGFAINQHRCIGGAHGAHPVEKFG
jgi:hypothetical protein